MPCRASGVSLYNEVRAHEIHNKIQELPGRAAINHAHGYSSKPDELTPAHNRTGVGSLYCRSRARSKLPAACRTHQSSGGK